jgi:hypothetical protein
MISGRLGIEATEACRAKDRFKSSLDPGRDEGEGVKKPILGSDAFRSLRLPRYPATDTTFRVFSKPMGRVNPVMILEQ